MYLLSYRMTLHNKYLPKCDGCGTFCGIITAVLANTGRRGMAGNPWPGACCRTDEDGTTRIEP